jgi:hypothetical protein
MPGAADRIQIASIGRVLLPQVKPDKLANLLII